MGVGGVVKKLLILGFVGYIGYEVYVLYSFCQPPLAADGVAWDLLEAPALDISLLLSLSDQRPRLPQEGERPGSSTHILIGEFTAVRPSDLAGREDLIVKDLGLPASFFANSSVYLHVTATRSDGKGKSKGVRHEAVRISRHILQADRRVRKRYLLGAEDQEVLDQRPVASLPKVVEVGFVQELRRLDAQGLQEKGIGHYVKNGKLKLPLYVNTLVSPRDEYAPLLENVSSAGLEPPSLQLKFRNVGLAYWIMQFQIGAAFDEAEKNMGLNEYDVDSFKQMIGGSSPYKIVLVYGVAILHLVFEFLAFTSDLDFWRTKTSFEGLSSLSITLQTCMNVIMFFYVQEQGQTKFVMYFIAFRFCLQLWKLRKLTTFERCQGFPFFRWVNRRGDGQGLEELEEVHDAERRCMKWLVLILLPVIVAFSVYRLIHQRWRSWYSWFIQTLAICAQTGGFVVMTPQVFMNWRLKSVEHLPWKALTYQAINTFIDDIFALCIRMPEVQKYSVFRDDIIFAICCYQRWIYKKEAVAEAVADSEGDEQERDSREKPAEEKKEE